MSNEAMESVEALRRIVEVYIDTARDATLEVCDQMADRHLIGADLAAALGDVDAQLLHVSVRRVFLAHGIAIRRADLIANFGHDPEFDDVPRGGA